MKHGLVILCFIFFLSCNYSVSNKKLSTLDSLSILIKEDSLDLSLLNQRALLHLDNNNFELAKNDIDNAYSIFKNDINVLLNRGDIYFKLNKTRISKESWERCLTLDPNQIMCREKLTNLLCAVKDSKCKSMIDILALLNNGIVSTSLIAYLKELKEYDLAISLLNQLLFQNSSNKEALSLLSIIYSDTSSTNQFFNIELAETYFKNIIELYSDYFQVYYNFGKHKQNISEYKLALKYYKIGLKLNSSDKQTYYNMGFCAMQLEEYYLGIEYFTSAINLDSSFLLAYHARAYLYELLNENEKVINGNGNGNVY